MNETKPTEREKRLDRKFTAIVYPDATDYNGTCNDVLDRLQNWGFPEWAYILHDRDKTEVGELKKPHYHLILRKTSPTSLITVARQLGIPSNYVQPIKNWKRMVKYLVHDENTDKFQYEVEEIISSDSKLIQSYFREEDETEQAGRILSFILDADIINYSILAQWCIANDLYATFRRNASMWSNIIRERQGR